MKQWEYLEGTHDWGGIKLDKYDKKVTPLNVLGKEGWELISSNNGSVIFKREINSSPTQNIAKPNPLKKEDDPTWGIKF